MQNADRDLDRHLTLLRNKIRQRGFTQLEVQEALGWGRSYLSQLLTKQKALRFEQVLMILNVIGDTPEAFFSELYPAARQPHHVAVPGAGVAPSDALAEDLQRLRGLVGELVSLLKQKDMLTTAELRQAVEQARHEWRVRVQYAGGDGLPAVFCRTTIDDGRPT